MYSSALESNLMALKRLWNISNQFCALLNIIAYHIIIAFKSIHLGLTVVIYGADLTEILNFRSFLANEFM